MSTPPPPPADELFLQAYDKHSDEIFRHCYFRTFDREQGKDLMQETFLRAWEFIAKGGEVRHMRGFLFKIANNLIINNAKKKKTVSLDALADVGFEPSHEGGAAMAKNVDEKAVLATMRTLPEEKRTILIMRYVEGLGPSEIAETLGLSANVVSVRLHRAVEHLRTLLEDEA